MYFFLQAEGGIRDLTVTGVQTCALPIWRARLPKDPFRIFRRNSFERSSTAATSGDSECPAKTDGQNGAYLAEIPSDCRNSPRSEERRVGKESRSRWSPYH